MLYVVFSNGVEVAEYTTPTAALANMPLLPAGKYTIREVRKVGEFYEFDPEDYILYEIIKH